MHRDTFRKLCFRLLSVGNEFRNGRKKNKQAQYDHALTRSAQVPQSHNSFRFEESPLTACRTPLSTHAHHNHNRARQSSGNLRSECCPFASCTDTHGDRTFSDFNFEKYKREKGESSVCLKSFSPWQWTKRKHAITAQSRRCDTGRNFLLKAILAIQIQCGNESRKGQNKIFGARDR